MAITVRAASQNALNAAGTSFTVPKPAGTVSGDFLVAFHVQSLSGTFASMTATSFTQTGGDSPTTQASSRCRCWTRIAGGAEPASYTFGKSNSWGCGAVVVAFTGVDTSSAIAAALIWAEGTGSTSHVAPSVSPPASGAMLVCGFSGTNSGAYALPSGMDDQGGFNISPSTQQRVGTEALSASGPTGTRIATIGAASGGWAAFSIALTPVFIPASAPPDQRSRRLLPLLVR